MNLPGRLKSLLLFAFLCLSLVPFTPEARANGCWCGDGNTPTLGCCGGDGERLCVVESIFSDCNAACEPGNVITDTLTCATPRQVGESCGPAYPCAENYYCFPFLQECVPDTEGQDLLPADLCLEFYQEDYHLNVVMGSGTAIAYGTGDAASAGVAGATELGVVYGSDGRFGCYLSQCFGVSTNLEASLYAAQWVFPDEDCDGGVGYDCVAGPSTLLTASAGEVLSFVAGVYYPPPSGGACIFDEVEDLGMPFAAGSAIAASASLSPVDLGCWECMTFLTTAIGLPPTAECADRGFGPAICADTTSCTAPANIDNGSSDPEDGTDLTFSQLPASPYPIGVTTVELTVTDSSDDSDSCSADVMISDCDPPTITCPAPTVAECTGSQQAYVDPGTATATDTCVEPSIITRPGARLFGLGTSGPLTYAASDGSNVSSCTTTVTVRDTTDPSITCPAPQTVECTGNGQASISYAASASDVCWGTLGTTCDPASPHAFDLGTTTISCRTTDGSGRTDSCSVGMTVEDTIPPVIIGVTASPNRLWPPSHKMKRIRISTIVEDVCDSGIGDRCRVISVTSDEPDAGLNEDDVPNDTEIVSADTVLVRQERDDLGDGRTYTAVVECTDNTGGNSTRSSVDILVPHDER